MSKKTTTTLETESDLSEKKNEDQKSGSNKFVASQFYVNILKERQKGERSELLELRAIKIRQI